MFDKGTTNIDIRRTTQHTIISVGGKEKEIPRMILA